MHKFVVSVMGSALLILACGCGSRSAGYQPKKAKPVEKAIVEAGKEASLLPLKQGNQWTYTIEITDMFQGRQQTRAGEISLRVAKVEDTPEGTMATLEVIDVNGRVDQTQQWLMSPKGLFQVTAGAEKKRYEPIQPLIQFPVTPGSSFSWTGSGLTPAGKSESYTTNSRVLSPEEVDTETETVSAIPIETRAKFGKGAEEGESYSVVYWSPGLGIARHRQEIRIGNTVRVQLMKLKASVVKP